MISEEKGENFHAFEVSSGTCANYQAKTNNWLERNPIVVPVGNLAPTVEAKNGRRPPTPIVSEETSTYRGREGPVGSRVAVRTPGRQGGVSSPSTPKDVLMGYAIGWQGPSSVD